MQYLYRILLRASLFSYSFQYLDFLNYEQTVSAFDEELLALGKEIKEAVSSPRDVPQKDAVQVMHHAPHLWIAWAYCVGQIVVWLLWQVVAVLYNW